MGCAFRSTFFIAMCSLFVKRGSLASLKCVVTCNDGEYCSGTECFPCPFGTFQSEPIHSFHSCKDWTNRQTEPHYILSKAGTKVSDAVWVCEDGYVEKQYTVGGFECVKMVTTSTVSSSTETSSTSTTPTIEISTAVLQLKQQSDYFSGDHIAGIVIGCVCGLVIVFAMAVYCIKKRRNDRQRLTSVNVFTNETLVSVQANSPTEPEPQTLKNHNIYYRFCLKFVQTIEVIKFKSFLNVLYDPSGKFHAGNVLQSESSKTPDVETYLAKSFLRWVELNNGIYRCLLYLALDDVGRAYELEEIEKLVPVTYLDGDDDDCDEAVSLLLNTKERMIENAVMKYIRASGAGRETTSSEGRKVLRQDQFRLFYFLTERIEPEELKHFVYELPGSSKFNARNYYNRKYHEDQNVSHTFALTVEEWWLQNPSLSLKNIITDFLRDKKINNILENSEFQKRLQKIVPADTSSAGNRDQEQGHSSQNLVSDAIDTHQVSHNIDTGHMSADSEGNHVSINNEGGHLSNNTEGSHVSNNTGDHVSNKSEGGHVSNNTGDHVSNNTGDHVSNNTGDHVSNNTGDHVSKNTGDHVANDNEGGHVSNNTDRDYVTNDSEGSLVSNNTDGDHVVNDTDRGHVPNITDGGHVPNITDGGHVPNNTDRDQETNISDGVHVLNKAQKNKRSNNERRIAVAESV